MFRPLLDMAYPLAGCEKLPETDPSGRDFLRSLSVIILLSLSFETVSKAKMQPRA